MDHQTTQEILEQNVNNRSGIIAILQDIQSSYNYLPKEELQYVSEKMDIPLIDLYGIASFYNTFSLTPRGKHLVQVCLGTACHVRGANRVLEEIKRRLGIEPGGTTEDKLFSLKTVNCLGACALGPIVVVDDEYHGNMRIQKVSAVLAKYDEKDDNQQ